MPLSEWEVAEYWNNNAAAWTDHVRRGFDVFRLELNNPSFFELIGDIAGLDVLDAGCGDGYNTRLFARRGARLTGVDIADAMLAYARDEERREQLGIRYENRSFTNLEGIADKSFDMVLSTMALMDAPKLGDALAEFARVLRPGGRLAFSVLHPCFMTRGFEWIRDAQGNRTRLKVGEYFDVASEWVDHWRFPAAGDDVREFAIPRFHRTLSEYLNSLIGAGFVLDKIVEPRASEDFCREYGASHWRFHAAVFLQCRAHKAG
jgi:SAM-dependent methyltransferase